MRLERIANMDRSKRTLSLWLGTLSVMLISGPAMAEIYRVIDKDGNISFTDQPPENSNAENIQRKIEDAVERNTTPSLETERANDPEWVKQAREERAKKEQEEEDARRDEASRENEEWRNSVDTARKKLKEAKAAQEAGKKAVDGDFIGNSVKTARQKLKEALIAQELGKDAVDGDFVGNARGGARPSEQYIKRQESLAEAVKEAEKALKQAKRARSH